MPILGSLSVRIARAGGDVANEVALDPPNSNRFEGKSHIVILVHGYNVDSAGAVSAYERFSNALADDRIGLPDVCHFHWPGDKPWPGVSAGSYAWQIPNAVDSARPLAATRVRSRR